MKRLWILGAPDTEMTQIENLLRYYDEEFVYATVSGRRVDSRTAYMADELFIASDISDIVFVESRSVDLDKLRKQYNVKIIDHHAPGDPGFGNSHERYWEASSLGQSYSELGFSDLVNDVFSSVTHHDLVVAAADAFPAQAIQGLCPHVTGDDIISLKISEIAIQAKVSNDFVRKEILSFRQQLRVFYSVDMAGQPVKDAKIVTVGPDYLTIAAMQTAVLAEGVAAMVCQEERDEKQKIALIGHAEPKTVTFFMEQYTEKLGLSNIYGNPGRGMAGGYLDSLEIDGQIGKRKMVLAMGRRCHDDERSYLFEMEGIQVYLEFKTMPHPHHWSYVIKRGESILDYLGSLEGLQSAKDAFDAAMLRVHLIEEEDK